MLRRGFLASFGAGVASLGIGEDTFAYNKKSHKEKPSGVPQKLERIAISTWSLHNYFRATRVREFNLPGPMLALLDLPEMFADQYNVHQLEVSSLHFPSTEDTYVRELKFQLTHAHSRVVNILVDIEQCGPEGTFSDPDPEKRQAAFEVVEPWVDIAHALDVKSVQVDPGKLIPENLAMAAEAYKNLASYAKGRGVQVLIENGDVFGAEHPEDLVKLLQLIATGRVGALPDLANFPDEATRQKGLKLLFPYAQTLCHAKSLEFNAVGVDTGYDFPEAMSIARAAGFRGVYSIDFAGLGDPYAGIQKTLDELLKYL